MFIIYERQKYSLQNNVGQKVKKYWTCLHILSPSMWNKYGNVGKICFALIKYRTYLLKLSPAMWNTCETVGINVAVTKINIECICFRCLLQSGTGVEIVVKSLLYLKKHRTCWLTLQTSDSQQGRQGHKIGRGEGWQLIICSGCKTLPDFMAISEFLICRMTYESVERKIQIKNVRKVVK